jgi:ParB family transcriptional regulator, chromosome partitioning protein
VRELSVDQILPSPLQPRRQFDEESITELADSIREHGVVQPLVVRETADGYELVAGERRLRAARVAGLEAVPVLVRDADDCEALQVALVENLQREDINAVDSARAYARLISDFGMTQTDIARAVGKSRTAVANTLRLLNLPFPVRDAVSEGRISEGHARALLGLRGENEMNLVLRRIEGGKLSVRDTEALVRDLSAKEPDDRPAAPPEPPRRRDPNVVDVELRLQRAVGTWVEVRPRRIGGAIVIGYVTDDDLARIADLLEGALGRVADQEG